jgi:molybdate transport system ATP-binding protein
MELEVSIYKKLFNFDLEVTFSCGAGRLLALVGPSGAGKTTLMRLLAGLEQPEAGRITYDGEVFFDRAGGVCLPPQRRRLGYVFQEYTLFPHLSLYKNVALAAAEKDRVEELLRRFGLWPLRDRKPQQLSGGERQRGALCQALARRPRVLLLDEPFSALDLVTRRKLQEELRALKTELAIPIIHVTHDLNEALFLADELLPLVRGRIDREWLGECLARFRAPDPEAAEIPDNQNPAAVSPEGFSPLPGFFVRGH